MNYFCKFLLPFTIVFVIAFVVKPSHQQKQLQEKAILNRILAGPYDRKVRPINNANASAPVVVTLNMYVRDIESVDDGKQEWSVQLTFRQQYQDDRLRWDNLNVSSELRYLTLQPDEQDTRDVWRPDIFFANDRRAKTHDLVKTNGYVRIFPDGGVLLSSRISLTLSCPMSLRRFPHDTQTCPMRMASYGYTNADILFLWKSQDPVQMTPSLSLPNFELDSFVTDHCDSTTTTGTYSCLRLDVSFKRLFKPYLIRVYIPWIMLVLVSWVTFWISKNDVTARLIFSLLILMSTASHILETDKNFPFAPSTRVLDCWSGICRTFVFLALLEFATVHYCSRKKQQRDNAANDAELPQSEQDCKSCNPKANSQWQKFVGKCEAFGARLDVYSRICFPLAFILFNIVYWATYVPQAE